MDERTKYNLMVRRNFFSIVPPLPSPLHGPISLCLPVLTLLNSSSPPHPPPPKSFIEKNNRESITVTKVGEYKEFLRVVKEWEVDARDGGGEDGAACGGEEGHARCARILVEGDPRRI